MPESQSPYRFTYSLAAQYLGCAERRIRDARNRGEIGHSMLGRSVRFSQAQLDEWNARFVVAPTNS